MFPIRAALLALAMVAAPHLVGKIAPTVPLKSLDGKDMSLPQARGNYVLMVFSDAKSRLLARTFLTQNAARFGGARGLSIYNIQVPGQALIPRAAWLYQARADAAKTVAEARAAVMSFQQEGFDQLKIRFHADFDRRFSDIFDAPGAVVSMILVDPNGYIVVQEKDVEEPAIQRVMQAIKQNKLAPGSHPLPRQDLASEEARKAAAARLGVKTPPAMKRERDEDEDETDAPPVPEEPAPESRDDGAVTSAPPPAGASKKKNRHLH